jgi:hypothetical protein
MKSLGLALILGVTVLAAGCSNMSGAVPSFQTVDLQSDLSQSDLARYKEEMKGAVPSTSSSEHAGHMMALEGTDWRLLGLLAYWNKGSVTAMHSPNGVHYMVTRAIGYGPLSILYVSGEHAIYSEDGKRQSYMDMDSIGWGHIAMFHTMGSKLDDGQWMQHCSSHLVHHLINFGEGHEGVFGSLGSAPNPIGFGE